MTRQQIVVVVVVVIIISPPRVRVARDPVSKFSILASREPRSIGVLVLVRGLGRQPRQLVVDEVQLAEHRESGERARLDAVQPAVLEIQLLQTGERTERVGRDVRDGVTLEAEYSHGRDVTEGRRRNGAQPVRLEVEDLEVAQSSERVWGDALDVIAAEVDVLQGLVGVERVDAEERQLVVREL